MRSEKIFLNAIGTLPRGASVLDVGCGETALFSRCKPYRNDLVHFGCDRAQPSSRPPGYEFQSVDLTLQPLPYPDDTFDFVMLSHVLEHLTTPVELLRECIRVLKPGGVLFVEAPSDRSTAFSLGRWNHWHLILSFWDDPTHLGRPWTPQSLYRLARYFSVEPVVTGYDTSVVDVIAFPLRLASGILRRQPDRIVSAWWAATGWVVHALMRKPRTMNGRPDFKYFSFKGREISSESRSE